MTKNSGPDGFLQQVSISRYMRRELAESVFSLLDLLLGPFSLRLPLGLSSLRQVFSLLGLLLGSFSLRLIPLGLSSLCQGFLFIRSSLKSLFFTSSFRCVGWEGWESVGWESVGWECGLGVCGFGELVGSVWVGRVWVYLLSAKVFSLSLRFFSLRFPLGLSILCQGCLFIRPSLRSSSYRYVYLLSVKVFSLLGFLLDPFSLRLHLGLSSLCQGLLFIRPSLRSFSLHFPLGFLLDPFSLRLHLGLSSLCLIEICNEQQARFYLKATNWDLNVAVVNYYDGTNA
ncbi:unnamed protein product [Rhizophagus irregularis]|nr:unnamed protein product [Rhizophagus irregularis]CAB5380067.1 unnamed protein product [Rhizophagus irregularis]